MSSLLPARLERLGDLLPFPSAEEVRCLARRELLRASLQRSLLEGLAEEVPAPPVEAEDLDTLRLRLGLAHEEELGNWRERMGIDLETLHRMAVFPRRLQMATDQVWSGSVASRFLERRGDLDQVVLTLVRFGDADLAQELYFQLREQELSFCELIETHATGKDQLRRGLLGPLPLQRLHPLLAKVVQRYPEGSLIPPIDLDGVVHLIRVESVIRAELNDAVRQNLLLELRNEWLKVQTVRYEARLSQLDGTPADSSSEGHAVEGVGA